MLIYSPSDPKKKSQKTIAKITESNFIAKKVQRDVRLIRTFAEVCS